MRTDTLNQPREDKRITNADRHIIYIARLFNDSSTSSRRERSRTCASSPATKSAQRKGQRHRLYRTLNVKTLGLDIEAVNIDQAAALDHLNRAVSAVESVAAKPVAFVTGFDPGERFHILPVPFVDALADKYFPATLTSKDYPKLVQEGVTVSTLAVGTVLGAYNWPLKTERYNRIARFVDAFFSKFEEFQKPPRHTKWREVNASRTGSVPGRAGIAGHAPQPRHARDHGKEQPNWSEDENCNGSLAAARDRGRHLNASTSIRAEQGG